MYWTISGSNGWNIALQAVQRQSIKQHVRYSLRADAHCAPMHTQIAPQCVTGLYSICVSRELAYYTTLLYNHKLRKNLEMLNNYSNNITYYNVNNYIWCSIKGSIFFFFYGSGFTCFLSQFVNVTHNNYYKMFTNIRRYWMGVASSGNGKTAQHPMVI